MQKKVSPFIVFMAINLSTIITSLPAFGKSTAGSFQENDLVCDYVLPDGFLAAPEMFGMGLMIKSARLNKGSIVVGFTHVPMQIAFDKDAALSESATLLAAKRSWVEEQGGEFMPMGSLSALSGKLEGGFQFQFGYKLNGHNYTEQTIIRPQFSHLMHAKILLMDRDSSATDFKLGQDFLTSLKCRGKK